MEFVRKATGSAAVITDAEQRVLLVRRAYPPHDWVLPGGNAEADESPIETVLREVREELGVEALPERLTGVYYQRDHRAGEFLHFVFRCSLVDDAIRPDTDEVAEYAFWPADALPEPMSVSTRRRLTDALRPDPLALPLTLPPKSET